MVFDWNQEELKQEMNALTGLFYSQQELCGSYEMIASTLFGGTMEQVGPG